MRVCQPGPVTRHREITSTGMRKPMSCLGLADLGRPPFFNCSVAKLATGAFWQFFALHRLHNIRTPTREIRA